MTIQDITVQVVNIEKLIAHLDIPLPENQKICIDQFAIYEDKFDIDIDSNFCDINVHISEKQICRCVEIPIRLKTYNEKGSYSIRMDRADFIKVLPLSEVLALAHEQKLTNFIRFNYNPRIISNQKLLMKQIRHSYGTVTT